MWGFKPIRHLSATKLDANTENARQYQPILDERPENEKELVEGEEPYFSQGRDRRLGSFASNTAKLTLLAICAILICWIVQPLVLPQHCENGKTPTVRREWRSLALERRKNYISALECLVNKPSKLQPDHLSASRFYDFAWTHAHTGSVAHESAAFLSWHRWLVQLFENTLRDECGYSDPLPYWDWTKDWKHIEQAPVFSIENGFGGNGDPNRGWCLHEGPFAGAKLPFENSSLCLSRKFAQGTTFNASHLSSRYVSVTLSKKTYADFLLAMEDGPHDDIPQGVRGTFMSFYAPADPLFFLHHAQLDRIWWMWQRKSAANARAYERIPGKHGIKAALGSLTDVLPFAGLGDNVVVEEIMNTEKGRLCYRYG
ncbi:Di-copper centre-containing [Lecanosticta acicola]|uniref:Di-copper centre-containing n=1 Tax=Lecanosticta acicola TaxID=111012 RepID=A0AAI8YZG9_9PEZI|nr:Di-copper centre-containing [Lecanosticta acicola]